MTFKLNKPNIVDVPLPTNRVYNGKADDNEPEVPVKRRKGVKQVQYKCEVIKEATVKGESYTSWKGNRVERKRKGEDCKCSMNFGSKNEQDAYLQSLITVHDIERRRQVSATNPKPRAHSYTYRVSCNTGSYPVCKKAFIAMHGITAMRVRRCTIYCRLELHPDSDILYSYYYKIFKERFNYSFGRPQVDTCVTCDELGVKIKSGRLNDVAKRAAIAEKIVHLRRSKIFSTKMKEVLDFVKDSNDSEDPRPRPTDVFMEPRTSSKTVRGQGGYYKNGKFKNIWIITVTHQVR
ncbi:hypothetical protein J6590_088907 [Homalodisca vitripennis]|nr:hypothetical protein J6590_088907 [Homalodisca vitripennis]